MSSSSSPASSSTVRPLHWQYDDALQDNVFMQMFHRNAENRQIDSRQHLRVVAPMVRYSKLPFRMVVRKWGADICHTPMVVAKEFNRSDYARATSFQVSPEDWPLVVQFAAPDPIEMAMAVEQCLGYIQGVDVNCGCPQKWAIADGIGAALIKKPDVVREIVRHCRSVISHRTMPDHNVSYIVNGNGNGNHNDNDNDNGGRVKSVSINDDDDDDDDADCKTNKRPSSSSSSQSSRGSNGGLQDVLPERNHAFGSERGPIPVSIKIRLRKDVRETMDLIRLAEEVGVAWITIHGRTTAERTKADVHYDDLHTIKSLARVPLIANGDVFAPDDIDAMIHRTGMDGVMSARGILDNPALFYRLPSTGVLSSHLRDVPRPSTSSSVLSQSPSTSSSTSSPMIQRLPTEIIRDTVRWEVYHVAPLECVIDYIHYALRYGGQWAIHQHHILYMLHHRLPKGDIRELTMLTSLPAAIHFLRRRGLWLTTTPTTSATTTTTTT